MKKVLVFDNVGDKKRQQIKKKHKTSSSFAMAIREEQMKVALEKERVRKEKEFIINYWE